ncbi:MAG: adenine deaminase [Balneolaceae bacterium]
MASVKGMILDVVNRNQFLGEVVVEGGVIREINPLDVAPERYILPGFVDAHIHIESSMLVPSRFARMAVRHGTVATVSDPHEIANVCGRKGVEFMIENGKKVPLKFYFGAPSCVPATPFETAGAELNIQDVEDLLDRDEIRYLAEMMNWPGVLEGDEVVTAKIQAALKRGKPVDGHAPGLRGERAARYAAAGITTDHECYSLEEAEDKLKEGMKIAIREGSAARNYEALIPLLRDYPGEVMFCSDDKHPDDLTRGHINELAGRSIARGFELFDTLHASCVLPVRHYGLDVGLLQVGDPADFVVVNDPGDMLVLETWIEGKCVFRNGKVNFPEVDFMPINNFTPYSLDPEDFAVRAGKKKHPVILARDGELVTGKSFEELPVENGQVQPDMDRDILKVAVVNRYQKVKPSVGFIKNFGIREGAIASSVAHDSHNIIAVGSSDPYLSDVVNLIMENEGGIAAVDSLRKEVLPLPVAGIMSDRPGNEVASRYENLNRMAGEMGSTLHSPFMLISFMALLVIPSLKISDKGMFDADQFEFIND